MKQDMQKFINRYCKDEGDIFFELAPQYAPKRTSNIISFPAHKVGPKINYGFKCKVVRIFK